MSNHIGGTNKKADTPCTDERVIYIDGNPWVNAPFARSLERELNAAEDRIKRLESESESRWMLAQSAIGSCAEMSSRIKRLEEAGDALANHHLLVVTTYDKAKTHVSDWRKAKEAKP